MTFTYHNQVPVSLILSKDDLKLRLQSPDFSSLWFLLKALTTRLHELDETFEVTSPDAIPLPELFAYIDEHSHCRGEIVKLRKSLEDRTY